jgi:hypothetical protein
MRISSGRTKKASLEAGEKFLFPKRGFSLAEGDHFSGCVVQNHRLSVASLSGWF